MKLVEVPMEKLMEALPKLSTNLSGDPVVFNLVTDVEEGRVPSANWHMKFDDAGAVTCGEGHKEEEGAITFILQSGGINTMLGFLIGGIDKAKMDMMMGKIGIQPMNPGAIKRTESFFKRVEIGEEPVKKALGEIGVEVDDMSL